MMLDFLFRRFLTLLEPDDEDTTPDLPPGLPPTSEQHRHMGQVDTNDHKETYEGPWFQTQLVISLALGITSFLIFSYCRTRWPLLFAPRTKLKGMRREFVHLFTKQQ